jgi:hypothetical protein
MDPAKLRALLYEKDKTSGKNTISPTSVTKSNLGSQNLGGNSLSVPQNKSAPSPMSPGLPNPMGFHQPVSQMQKPASTGMPKTIGAPKMTLPNPTAAPSVIGQQPSLPKPAKFGRTKKLLKPTKEF